MRLYTTSFLFSIVLLVAASLPVALGQEPAEADYPQIPITPSGVQIFPQPDSTSGRLFAVLGDFAPYVGGISEDGEWLYIYFFNRGELMAGWASVDDFDTDNLPDDLPTIDPDALPDLPDLPFDPLAVLPVGVSSSATSDDLSTQLWDAYQCVHLGGDVFQWDVVEVTLEDGVPVEVTVVEMGVTGDWRSGCPEGEMPQSQASGGSGDSSGSTDDDDGSGGSICPYGEPEPGCTCGGPCGGGSGGNDMG